MSASVGADIEALCSKCGDVWHVVVAKVGAEIVKVQCKECGGYHRYRRSGAPAASAPKARAAADPSARRSTGGARAGARARAAATSAAHASSFQPDLSAPMRPYRMSETFRPGEQIKHPRFGVGLVEQSSEPGKMAVLFSDGRRILAQAKPASTLGTAEQMPVLTDEE